MTLSFETNGGSLINPVSGLPGGYVAQPSTPSRNGFTFAGWYAEADLSTPYVFSSLPDQSQTVYADWESNYLVFTAVNTDEWMVNGNTLNNPTQIWVPKYHQGKLVTTIDTFGFYGLRTLTQLKLPDSITQIGDQAFSGNLVLAAINVYGQGTHFKSVDGILYSGDGKTLVCYPMGKIATTYTIAEGVEIIGKGAFENEDNLTEVVFPSTLKSVGEKAFIYCLNLTSVVFNEGLETIGEFAFYYMALLSVNFPSTLTSFAINAFDSSNQINTYTVAAGNTHFSAFEGNLYNASGTTLIRYAVGKTQDIFEVPSGVTTIGAYAFRNAGTLKQIILPSGLTTIENGGFYSCGITEIDIPPSVAWIGDFAFRYCNTLTSIYIPSNVAHMGYWVFHGCDVIQIYVQAANPGSSWDLDWNASKPVTWAYGG